MLRMIRLSGLALAMLLASQMSALADRIDGTWCGPEGKTLSVNGPSVTTPGGNGVVARYNRHHVDYEIPAGEANAGDRFSADQLNDEQIQVVVMPKSGGTASSPEIWKSCVPIS